MRKNVQNTKFLFITKYICNKNIPLIKDRIETFMFIEDSELHEGMQNYLTELNNNPPLNPGWREKLQSL